MEAGDTQASKLGSATDSQTNVHIHHPRGRTGRSVMVLERTEGLRKAGGCFFCSIVLQHSFLIITVVDIAGRLLDT